jgi:hypothetical protein
MAITQPRSARGLSMNENPEDQPHETRGDTNEAGPAGQTMGSGRYGPADRCGILGVTKVGKTFLLGAMYQACQLSGADGHRLTFTPQGGGRKDETSTSELIREMVLRIIKDAPTVKGTLRTNNYRFTISCRASTWREPMWWLSDILTNLKLLRKSLKYKLPWSSRGQNFEGNGQNGGVSFKKLDRTMGFEVLDSPGGSHFPGRKLTPGQDGYDDQQKVIEYLSNAYDIIVCIDASDPNLTNFATDFPHLHAEAQQPDSGRLRATRLLLLLTKIDSLADRFLDASRESLEFLRDKGQDTLALEVLGGGQVSARRLAEMLDPVDTARALLGQATVSMVRRSLEDHAEMAIGVCSSTGFYDDGQSFWNNSTNGGPRLQPGASPDDAFRSWSPFGVKEMVLFLLTGRYGRTIQPYSWRDDMKASERRSFRITLTSPVTPGATSKAKDGHAI